MQLIERNQHRLREVERSVVRSGNSYYDMRSIEYVVRQTLVLPSEQKGHGALARKVEQLHASGSWSGHVAFRGSPSGSESRNPDTAVERFLDRVAVLDALDDVAGVVGDTFQPPGVVFHRADQVQIGHAHVLHRAYRRGNVDRVLRLVENDAHRRQDRDRE